MAIANSDGSIILSTKVDTSGAKKGFQEVNNFAEMSANKQRSLAQSLSRVYRKQGLSQSEAQKKAWKELKNGTVAAKDYEEALEDAERKTKSFGNQSQKSGKQAKGAFDGLKSTLQSVAGYLALAFSVTKIIQFGQEAINLASDLQEVQNVVDTAFGSMAYKIEDFSKTAIEQFGLSKLAAKQWASTMMAMGSGMGQAMEIGSDMAVELTGRLADVMSFYNKTEEEAFTLGKAIYSGETEPLKSIGIIMTENNLSLFAMSKGYQQAYKDMDAANKLLVRQQFFLEQTSLAAGDYTKTADGWANQTRTLSQRWKEMQTVFGETLIAIGVLVLPVIEEIIKGLNQIAIMAKAAASNFGLFKEEAKATDKSTETTAEESEKTADNIAEQVENQKDLNKEIKKTLAGFDDIQILSSQTAENTTGGLDSGLQGIGGDLGGNAPDGSAYVEEINETLTAIMGIVALSLAAVGLILLFTGHIGYGIGFIIAGAATLTVTMASASEFGYDGIIQMLTTIMGVAGGALLAIGIMLLWLGVTTGIAIGMIIAGGALIVSAVAAQAAFAPDDIAAWLSLIMGIAGGALLALGVILCMVGSIPMGVGMIIAGAVSLVSAVALNSDAVVQAIRGPIGIITAIVSAALLVLGIILVCTGVLPLGIGLIAAGAIGLATVVAINWDAIVEKTKEIFNAVVDWIKTYGLLVLGIILCLTGTGIPLGIALIIKWAKEGAENGVPLATAIVDKVKEIWASIKAFWDEKIAPIFTAKFWLDLAKKCGNGLIEGFENAINGITGMFEAMINWIIDGLNKLSFNIPDWVPGIGGKTFGVNLSKVDFGGISIPRLAKGTVVPPNKRFIAELGDNTKEHEVVSPLSTIRQAVTEAMVDMGGTVKEEHYYLNETQLMSIVYKLAKNGERLNGESLVGGVI